MKVSLAEEMRQIDKKAASEYAVPEIILMENAGHRSAEVMDNLLAGVAGKTVVVLVGSGNNGGDALTAARHLYNMGAKLKIFLAGNSEHFSASTKVMYEILTKMGLEIYELTSDPDWDRLHLALKFANGVVDGILGTGFQGELRKKLCAQ